MAVRSGEDSRPGKVRLECRIYKVCLTLSTAIQQPAYGKATTDPG